MLFIITNNHHPPLSLENVMGVHNDTPRQGDYVWHFRVRKLFVGYRCIYTIRKKHFNRIGKHAHVSIDQGNDRLILSGLLAGLVGYLIQQQFTVIEYTVTLHFWVFLAASVVIVNPTEEKDSSERIATKKQLSQNKSPIKAAQTGLPNSPLLFMLSANYGNASIWSLLFDQHLQGRRNTQKGSDFLAYATTHQESEMNLIEIPIGKRTSIL